MGMDVSRDEEGVYFDLENYVGVWRRVLIDISDVIVAVVLCCLVFFPVLFFLPEDERLWTQAFFLVCAAVWFAYFVILKRSRFRTVGYIVGGARIVNLQGNQPSVVSLIIRLLFALIGPFNFVIDLFWVGGDPYRQALRDKLAHTYVIRKGAQPAGPGRIVYANYTIFGFNFLFQEVRTATEVSEP
jgi:uncharacterized RDD family membrane protein YckC